ncbi:hypothetical protein HYSC106933_11970 [Hydrogenibacillus schlegelii]
MMGVRGFPFARPGSKHGNFGAGTAFLRKPCARCGSVHRLKARSAHPPAPLRLRREGHPRSRAIFGGSGFPTGPTGASPIRMPALIEKAPAKKPICVISFITRWTPAPPSSYGPRPRSSRALRNERPPPVHCWTSGVSTPLFACKASPETVDMPIRKRAIASKRSAPRVAPSRPGSGESTQKMEQDQGGTRSEQSASPE